MTNITFDLNLLIILILFTQKVKSFHKQTCINYQISQHMLKFNKKFNI